MKRCKICGSLSNENATKCVFCGSDFASTSKEMPLRSSNHAKTPMEGIVVILLLLAISFLPTIPIALALSGSVMDPEAALLLCWAVIFVVSLIVYRVAKANTMAVQAQNLPYHESDDVEVETSEPLHEEIEPQPTAPAPFAEGAFSNSAFSAALYDACRHVDYLNLPAYDADMSCETAGAYLAGRASKHNHTFDSATARTLLGALAARRMILFCGNDAAELDRAMANVAALTGESTTTVRIGRNCTAPNDLYMADPTADTPMPSPFLRSLYTARMRQKSICPFLLDAEAPNKLGAAMSDIKPYLENGMEEGSITVRTTDRTYGDYSWDEVISLPANTRLFFAYRPGSSTPMPKGLMDVCAFVNLKNGTSAPDMLNALSGALSFERLVRLCSDSEERYALSEENWKRIDDLAEKLSEVGRFTLDNKLVTAMERFVGVYMAAGGSEQQALDGVLATLLLPAALTALSDVKKEDAPALSQLLDTCFGMENLPACAEMLKKFSAN